MEQETLAKSIEVIHQTKHWWVPIVVALISFAGGLLAFLRKRKRR